MTEGGQRTAFLMQHFVHNLQHVFGAFADAQLFQNLHHMLGRKLNAGGNGVGQLAGG